MKDILNWYFNHIPTGSAEFTKFLSNSAELGHPSTAEYTPTASPYPSKTPLDAVAHIPAWYFDPIFEGTLLEIRALTTALWNNGIRMTKELHEIGGFQHYNSTTFNPYLVYSQFVRLLYANERITETRFAIFNRAANDHIYTTATLAYNVLNNNIQGIVEHYLNPNLRQNILGIVGDEIVDVLERIVQRHSLRQLDKLSRELERLLENQDSDESDLGEEWLDQQPNINPVESSIPEVISTTASEEAQTTTETLTEILQDGGWDKQEAISDEVHLIDVLDAKQSSEQTSLIASTTLANLTKYLRRVKVINEPPVIPQQRGTQLLEDELYRVRLDGKVMGIPDEMIEPVRKEFIISCDLSGSTNTPQWPHKKHLWQIELEAAKGAFIALKSARETVIVYGHTTRAVDTVVYKIADNRSRSTTRRFEAATALYKGSNYDQYVLMWYAYRGFRHPDTKKFIFMLSDGKPCGPDGGAGSQGNIELTHNVVQKLRNRGITIISFSLVPGVISNNNEIYGLDWNIDATQNLDEALKTVLLNINTRR